MPAILQYRVIRNDCPCGCTYGSLKFELITQPGTGLTFTKCPLRGKMNELLPPYRYEVFSPEPEFIPQTRT